MPLHSSYMILQTRTFNRKIVSIGVLNSRFFFLLIYFLRTPLHELVFYSFKLFIMLVSLITQPCACIFQPNLCSYLSYVFSTSQRIYKLKLLHMLTTEQTLHCRVNLPITQNVDCCFS